MALDPFAYSELRAIGAGELSARAEAATLPAPARLVGNQANHQARAARHAIERVEAPVVEPVEAEPITLGSKADMRALAYAVERYTLAMVVNHPAWTEAEPAFALSAIATLSRAFTRCALLLEAANAGVHS